MIVIGPLLTVLLLLALPFVSNKGERSPRRRPWAVFGSVCVVVFVFSLFLEGERASWSPRFKAKPLDAAQIRSADTSVIGGATLFYKKGCLYCHKINGNGGLNGPDLSHVALRLSPDQMTTRIVNGGDNMPAYGGMISNEQMQKILTFLKSRK
jgi:ubiquinol-cytochrome c reductase cytochrome b subunit